jgi:hypothetical protein
MLRTADAGDDKVEIGQPLGINLHQGSRKEVSSLLVVAFEYDAIRRRNEGFEGLRQPFSWW